ncbi:MAG: Calx-beta domain-containing protein [Acidobacteriota bacterium]|nr:Calx-beta domain-containing protein [Acidobacteriota bacterium]
MAKKSVMIILGMALAALSVGASEVNEGKRGISTFNWSGAGGDGLWSNPANWTSVPDASGQIPGVGGQVGVPASIDLIGTYTVTLDIDVDLDQLTVGAASGTQTLSVGAGRIIDSAGVDTITANGVMILDGGTYREAAGVRGALGLTINGSLEAEDATVDRPLYNSGVLIARGNTVFQSTVNNQSGGNLRIEATASKSADIVMQQDFTNAFGSTTRLNSGFAGFNANLSIISAGRVLSNSGTVISEGSEGTRVINCVLSNIGGTIQVDYPLLIQDASGGGHFHDGSIVVNNEDLIIDLFSGSLGMGSTTQIDIQGANGRFNLKNGTFNSDGMILSSARGPGIAVFENVTVEGFLNIDIEMYFKTVTIGSSAGFTVNATANFEALNSVNAAAGVTNNGTIKVVGEGGASRLDFNTTWTNSGAVTLDSVDGSEAVIGVSSGDFINDGTLNAEDSMAAGGLRRLEGRLVNNASRTITVNGMFKVDKMDAMHVNNGTIDVNAGYFEADQSGTSPSFANNATIDVVDGATFHVLNGTFTQSGPGMLVDTTTGAPSASTPQFHFENASISGSNLTNTVLMYLTASIIDSDASIDNQGVLKCFGLVDVNGQLTNDTSNSFLKVVGESTGDGHLRINNLFSNDMGSLYLESNDAGFSARVEISGGATLTNGFNGTIVSDPGNGGGRFIEGVLSNFGILDVNYDLTLTEPAGAAHVNNGTVNCNSGRFYVPAAFNTDSFTNNGTINIITGSSMQMDGGIFNNAGVVSNSAASPIRGIIANDGLILESAEFQGSLTTGGTTFLIGATITGSLTNNGTFIVHGSNQVDGALTNGGTGTLWLQGNSVDGDAVLNYVGAAINDGLFKLDSVDSGATAAIVSGSAFNNNGVLETSGTPGMNRQINASLNNSNDFNVQVPTLINRTGGAHSNGGTTTVMGGPLTVDLSGGGVFTNGGTLTIQPGNGAVFNGGTFAASSGVINDGGVRGSTPLFQLDTMTVQGGTLTTHVNVLTQLLDVNFAASGNLDNRGPLEAYKTNTFNGTVTNALGGVFNIGGSSVHGNAICTMNAGMTNNGTLELDTNTSAHNAVLNVTGSLANNLNLNSIGDPGSAPHEINGQLTNDGTMTVNHDLNLSSADLDHTNNNQIAIPTGTLNVIDTNAAAPVAKLINFGILGVDGVLGFQDAELDNNNVSMMIFGVLSGNGTVNGPISNSGFIAAGNSAGTLNVNGDVSFTPDGHLVVEIEGDTPGTGYDQLVITGNLALDGFLDVQFIAPWEPTPGEIYIPITWTGSVAGDFGTIQGNVGPNGVLLEPNLTSTTYELVATSGDIFWTGAVNDDWQTAGNWNPAVVPGPINNVVIDLDGTYTVNINAAVDINGLAVGGPSGAQTLATNGNVIGISGPMVVGPNAIIDMNDSMITDNTAFRGLPPSVDNNGSIQVRGSSVIEPAVTNFASGIISIDGDSAMTPSTLSLLQSITNAGLIELTSTASADSGLSVDGDVNNTGVVHFKAGVGGDRFLDGGLSNDTGGQVIVDAVTTVTPDLPPKLMTARGYLKTTETTLALFSFDGEGDLARDATDNQRHLELSGLTRAESAFGRALVVDQQTGLGLGDLVDELAQRNEWTLEYLTYADEGMQDPLLVVTGSNLDNSRASRPGDGRWHYHAVTWDGELLRFWRDGELTEERPGPLNLARAVAPPRLIVDAQGDARVTGLVDELKLTDGAIDQESVAATWRRLELMNPIELDPALNPDAIQYVNINGEPMLVVNRQGDTLYLRGNSITDRVENVTYRTYDGQTGALSGYRVQQEGAMLLLTGGERVAIGVGGVINTASMSLNTGGSLIMNGGVLDHQNAGVINGSGTIDATAATFYSDGILVPGFSPGGIDILGDVTFGSTSLIMMEIAGLSPGAEHDQINITGTAALGGQLDVDTIDGFIGSPGESVNLINFGSRSDDFTGVTLPSPRNGIGYTDDNGPGSFDLDIVALNPVSGIQVFPIDAPQSQVYGIDALNGNLNGIAPTGVGPGEPGVSSDGSRLYVPNSSSGTVTIVDTGLKSVLGTINGFNTPTSVAVLHGGNEIWVTDGGQVRIADLISNTVTDTLDKTCFDTAVERVAHNRSTGESYVIGKSGNICVLDTVSKFQTGSFSVPGVVSDAVLTPAGDFLYIGATGGTVYKVSTSAGTNTPLAVGGNPTGVDITGDGSRVFVANGTGNAVIIDTGTNGITSVPLAGASNLMDVAAVSGVDRAWFTVGGSGTLFPLEISTATPELLQSYPDANFTRIVSNQPPQEFPGTFRFSLKNAYNFREDTGTAVIEVERVGGSQGAFTIQVTSANGTAQAPGDFVAVNETLFFAEGVTRQTFEITINDDRLIEGPEDFDLLLGTPVSAGRGIFTDTVTVTIEDWEEGSLSFSAPTYNGLESDQTVTVRVNRTGGTDGTVRVDVAVPGGTATLDQDYSFGTFTVNLADGVTFSDVEIDLLDDNLVEGPETIILGLENPTDGAIIDPLADQTTVVIEDVEIGEIQFASPMYSVDENLGPADIVLQRVGGSTGTLAVVFNTADGTAVAPDDYGAVLDLDVVFADGETLKTVQIPIVDDEDLENPVETVFLSFFPGGFTRGEALDTAVLEILDDERPPVPGEVRFTAETYDVIEGQDAMVVVERVNGSDGTIVVDVSTRESEGGAQSELDFVPVTTTLIFEDGQVGPVTVPVSTVDDEPYEPVESFEVVLTLSEQRNIGTPSVAVVNITDDEPPPSPGILSFAFADNLVDEPDGEVTLEVRRQNGSAGEVSVTVQTRDDTATAGDDYLARSIEVTFADGEDGVQTVTVPILNDSRGEVTEQFFADLIDPTGGATLGEISQTRVVIRDDDQRTVAWVEAAVDLTERSITLIVEAALDAPLNDELRVDIVAGGSATRDVDYRLSASELVFPAGSDRADVRLTIIDDDVVEGREFIVLNLVSDGSVRIGRPERFTVALSDNDLTEVRWQNAFTNVTEGSAGKVSVTVNAVLANPLTQAIEIPYTVSGDATPGVDHDLQDGILSFPAGESNASVTFEVLDDNIEEMLNTLVLSLEEGDGYLLGIPSQHQVRIRDNDRAVLSWTLEEQILTEDDEPKRAQTVQAEAVLSNTAEYPITADYNVGGNARRGQDFQLEPGTLTFEPGQTSATIEFTVLGDLIPEAEEQIILDLIPSDQRQVEIRRQRVIIADNDQDVEAPDTAIDSPENGAEFRVGATVDHAASVIFLDTFEPFRFLWERCKSDGSDCHQFEGQTFTDTYDEPGLYILTCFVTDARGVADRTPAQTRIRVLPNRPPRVTIVDPVNETLDLPVNATLTFRGQAVDPDDALTKDNHLKLDWFFQKPVPEIFTGSPEFEWTFDEPGTFNLVFRATDEEGASGADNIVINVFEEEPPLRVRIAMPQNGDTFQVGEEISFMGVMENALGKEDDLIQGWTFGDGTSGFSGPNSTHIFDEPGRYRVRFLVRNQDRSFVLEDQIVINIRNQDPPVVDFSFPTDLNLLPGGGSGKDEHTADAFFSALVRDDKGNEDLSFVWEFNTGEGDESRRYHETPGRFPFEEEGNYTVSVWAVTPEGVTSNVAVRTVTVRNTEDADFEPNDTDEDAPTITPGEYGNLSLDGDPDIYRVEVTDQGQRLLFRAETEGQVRLNLYNEDGDMLIENRILDGQGNVQLPGLEPGVYTIKLEQVDASKVGLNYSFGVSVLNPALFFPDIRVDSDFETQVGVVNLTSQQASIEIIGYDAQGNIVDEVPYKLSGKARTHLDITSLFGDNAEDVSWVQVDSTHTVTGYSRTEGRDREEVYAVSGNDKLSSELYVPHIAEKTDQWFTRSAVINGSDLSSVSTIDTPGQDAALQLTEGFSKDDFEFIDRFGGTLEEASEWAVFKDTDEQSTLAGVEVFGTKDGNRVVAGLALADASKDNPNFTFVANNLYFTHIARGDFYTGIALVNIGSFMQGARIVGYDVDGNVVDEVIRTLEVNEKIVETDDQFLADFENGEEVAWVLVEADEDVVGFELFGTSDGETIAGLEASTGLSRELCYPFIDTNTEVAHGISVINVNDTVTTLTFILYDDDGNEIAGPVDILVNGNGKLISTIPDLFPEGAISDTEVPGWLSVTADAPIAGFELFINTSNNKQMGAITAQ